MENKKIRAILTGATGMVGEGVLHICLLSPAVEAVLVVGRRPCGVVHPKLTEIVHGDLYDLSMIESRLGGYNACFFCLGVSSLGMKETEYTKISYSLTMTFAGKLCALNPGMTFCYVSGAGTDATEKGRMMWARVKGKTENHLAKLPFRAAYSFRPAFMRPIKGMKNTLSFYHYITWLYPVLHPLFPGYFGTLKDLGLAMINSVLTGYKKRVLDAKDIAVLAKRNN